MTAQDIAFGALCAWREDRGGGTTGMHAVINTLINRATRRGTSVYAEATRKAQYDALVTTGDPNLTLYADEQSPSSADTIAWEAALDLMQRAAAGTLQDITDGATNYYASSMKTPPYWVASMTFTVELGGQRFYK